MSILYKCDRCGNVFEKLSLENEDYILQIKGCEPIDLCDDCINNLKRWLDVLDAIEENTETDLKPTLKKVSNITGIKSCATCMHCALSFDIESGVAKRICSKGAIYPDDINISKWYCSDWKASWSKE